MKKHGFCYLCKKDQVELHKKSHIIPKFLFKNIFGDDGQRLLFVESEKLKEIKRTPDSPYEKYIFCKNCENFQSAIESKASQLLYYKKLESQNILRSEGSAGEQLIYKDANSNVLKKFLLLILWRADITNHETFKFVNLGVYRERFRKIINEEKGISTSNCHFHIFNFGKVLDKKAMRICSPFFRLKISGRNCYCIFIDGVGYLYHFGNHVVKLLNVTELDSNEGVRINLPNKKTSKELFKLFGLNSFNLL